jgi:hypothetical protein
MSELLYEKDGAIATITLNRPERLNAISVDMLAALDQIEGQAVRTDPLHPAITRHHRAVIAVRTLPRPEVRRLGIQDEPVEIEDQRLQRPKL